MALIKIKIDHTMGLRGPKPGCKKVGIRKLIPAEERLVQIPVSVKRKHYNQAVSELKDFAKKFKV